MLFLPVVISLLSLLRFKAQEFKFFNYLLPRMDLIQLPVFSLERHWYELVAGTYMDEFAEAHGKDMLVREHIAGVVPSSGVGWLAHDESAAKG